MSDPLTLARATPLGPYVPATEAMLRGWCGPCEMTSPIDRGWNSVAWSDALGLALTPHVRLDTRRKEVRWRLVDLGLLPVALRDHPGAAVAAGMGARVEDVLRAYVPSDLLVGGVPQLWIRRSELTRLSVLVAADGWSISRNGVHTWDRADYAARGREAGPAGKLAADLAALRLGCVLEEPDGYLIPLPDGGVGFVSKESP